MKKTVLTLFLLITAGVTLATFSMGYLFGCSVWDSFYENQEEKVTT